jgi:RNA recognition motif-containing protein
VHQVAVHPRLGVAGPSPGACAGKMENTESQTLSKKEQKKLEFFNRLKKKKNPALNKELDDGAVSETQRKRKRNPGPDKKSMKGERGKGKRRDVETQIYIGGLPYKMSEDDVKTMFQSCGNIKSVNLPINKHGKPTGFGFIVFESAESIPKALVFDGQEVEGRFIQATSDAFCAYQTQS